MKKAAIINAHTLSSYHREGLATVQKCGCFYCLEIFLSNEIEDWTDSGNTALCPHCGIDAVITEAQEQLLDRKFLSAMHNYWF